MFIVFEGVEGAGKSTQLRLLHQRLLADGRDVLCLKEPGGTPAGEALRTVLLAPSSRLEPLTELFIVNASRHQLVQTRIVPALAAGQWVLCDRYIGSSLAYQGYGRGLQPALVQQLCDVASGGLRPQLTILLDLDARQGLARVAARSPNDALDRLEGEALSFHERVRQGFLEQAQQPGWHTIDASQPEAAVAQQVWDAVATPC